MEFRKEANEIYSLIYQFLFIVKYKHKVFVEGIGIIEDFKERVKESSCSFDVKILEIECGIDHAHLLISMKSTLSIKKLISSLKGHGSRYLRQLYREFLRDKSWGDAFWSLNYFIATTGNVSIATLEQYIENQRERLEREN